MTPRFGTAGRDSMLKLTDDEKRMLDGKMVRVQPKPWTW